MTISRIFPLVVALAALPLCPAPASADSCGDLADKVVAETKAEIGERIDDFVRFKAGTEMTLSLSCGGSYPSSVGAQFKGEAVPDAFFDLFGNAGHAVTGVAADLIMEAARKARSDAETRRHSNVPTGGVLVTCSYSKSDKGPLTMCAAIEQADRS
ncbi:ABC transporter ATPase [Methylobacterium haplocladii]|uniref:ABC transporter ATPase n=1 Tax=Methylobacterium haplocladii TaxID=1176176 RepID=A0A512IK39_9HYPH|nr:ABC transporter ATPase [Methylobacterium haplocladii]GEO98054.1 hypothetical protein MHA02_04420 [Methylobacterium haplocladii]GJD85675.1 hypothetical protein HPGCJGGD_3566 [Methylobacterium haplocladii]GLS60099.1 hypothetical protein GCM10007887_27760 [Methylobacterium haplocladii]